MTKELLLKYFKGSFFLNLPTAVNTIITLISLPIVLASLPMDDYGKWQFVLAIETWFVTLSAQNITTASKRGIAKGLDGTFLYAFRIRAKLLLAVGILVIGLAFYFRFTGKDVLFQLTLIVGVYLGFGFLFQPSLSEFMVAKERFMSLGYLQISIFSVSMIGATVIAYFTKSIVYFVLFQLAGNSIVSLAGLVYIVIKYKLIASYQRGEIDKDCIPYGLKMIPVDLITITAGKLSNFIIGPFWGFADLAVFSVASRLRDKFAMVIKSARPLMYADFARIEEKELAKKINKYIVHLGELGLVISVLLVIFGSLYIRFFLPEKFIPAIKYMIILSLGLPAGVISIVLHSMLETHLLYKQVRIAVVVPNIIKVLLILIFGYIMKTTGICIAVALSGWISLFVYYLLIFNKRISTRFR